MAINTNDVVTNIVSGIETIKNGSIVTTCLRTGRYNTIAGNDNIYDYTALNTKETNRFGNIAYYNGGFDNYATATTTTTAAPTIPTWGVSNSEWAANSFTGSGTYAIPFTAPSIRAASTVWASKQILSNSYLKFSWTASSTSDCQNDNFAVAFSTSGNVPLITFSNSSGNWKCQAQSTPLVFPVNSGLYFVLEPDADYTFTNLKIWLSSSSGINN
jgi:hypothetical protein